MTELSLALRDLPMTLAGCHGRIGAYRDALVKAERAMFDARPYCTDKYVHRQLNVALELVRAELAVTNPVP